jgi:hypothetical protein
VSRGRLVIHGHFYQPSRVDPFSGRVPPDPTAAPAHDWNARISAECYRPNAERGNLGHINWDLGPTLAAWLQTADPVAYLGFVAGDRRVNGMAQPYHHTILPLASAADRRTEIAWGLRDFAWRFGRPATGMWLPECAVDLPTLRLMADAGLRHTILAPWQARTPSETRRPYRVDVGGGRSVVVAFYDGELSSAVSFEPAATEDADRFARDGVEPRFAVEALPDDDAPLVVIATDGELYGHHQPFREFFLERLVQPRVGGAAGGAGGTGGPSGPRSFDVVALEEALVEPPGRPFRAGLIAERTSWSCHHGVLRWTGECGCAADGRWKAPLRAALERLAAAIDTLTDRLAREIDGAPDPWTARDSYVDVVIGASDPAGFGARWVPHGDADARARFAGLMEIQRWRLAMFASDGWYWDDPMRPETANVLRAAARAARSMDVVAGTTLERRLVDDLSLFTSPGHGFDGAEIYRRALSEVGQPARVG